MYVCMDINRLQCIEEEKKAGEKVPFTKGCGAISKGFLFQGLAYLKPTCLPQGTQDRCLPDIVPECIQMKL